MNYVICWTNRTLDILQGGNHETPGMLNREFITRHPICYRDAITRHAICYRYSVTRHPVYYGEVIMRQPI